MQNFKVGDSVGVLGDTIKGIVVSVDTSIVEIEDSDGFLRRYTSRQLVLQKSEDSYKIGSDIADKEAKTLLRSTKKTPLIQKVVQPTEIDLHIEMLRDSHAGLANYEIIQIQMTACRSFVQQAIENGQKKIVLIHGKGQGVLKAEIHTYLMRLNNTLGCSLTFHDASFQSYGIGGATEVIIG